MKFIGVVCLGCFYDFDDFFDGCVRKFYESVCGWFFLIVDD